MSLKNLFIFRTLNKLAPRNLCTSPTSSDFIDDWNGRPKSDPVASAFFQPSVQMCLGRLTGLDYTRVFRVARRGQEIKAPKYVFMTEQELQDAKKNAEKRAKQKWLQMPPVMSPRTTETRILEKDPAIQGYDGAKYVFTDITYGVNDRARFIVVREPDGTLREACGEERDRLNQTYFPREGRKIQTPMLFKDPEVLSEVLKQGGDRYLYVLDRTCVQFEPDHPKFVAVSQAVYDAVDERRDYSLLKSTRYFGPLVFYLVLNKRCDNFIAFQLKSQNISDVFDVVHLYALLHPNSKVASLYSDTSSSSSSSSDEEDNFEGKLEMLRTYIKEDSAQGVKLNLGLESMLEQKKNQENSAKGIIEAHGGLN